MAAVMGFSDTSVYTTERGAAQPYLAVGQFTQLLTGIHFYGLYALHLELSLRDPLCHPLVHTCTVLCLVGYLLPIIDPDHVVVAGSPVLQWFHSPLCVVRGDKLNCRLGKEHLFFSSLRGSWSVLTAKLDSDYSRTVMFYFFIFFQIGRAHV